MTPLEEILRQRIMVSGPITIEEFMATALMHPRHGYYMTRNPFGAEGDFITAPEISQAFGELIGLWCAVTWQSAGAPDPVALVELGPGRGTLMADALRAMATAPGFRAALTPWLVEASPTLRAAQSRALGDAGAHWCDSLNETPDGPMLLIANEFFDALPIRQLERTPAGWRERLVGWDEQSERLRPVLAPAASPVEGLLVSSVRSAAPVGAVAEVAPEAVALMRRIAERVAAHGVAALIFDYGHPVSAPGDTLQAVRGHRYADPFQDVGKADMTAHVDFGALAEAARAAGGEVHGPVGQGDFLRMLGIEARRDALLATLAHKGGDAAAAERIRSGVARLIEAGQMGTVFKAMAVTRPDDPVPPGFEGSR